MLLAATRGRLPVSVVLLEQDLGKTLTAAPASIRYLDFYCFTVTYNNLEGDNVGRVDSAESCRISVISPNDTCTSLQITFLTKPVDLFNNDLQSSHT